MHPVFPMKSPAAYLGGKSKLAKKLVAAIESFPHRRYAEVFFGMGSVFFARSQAPHFEIINDINADVINFFRVAQRHPAELRRLLQYKMQSRQDFSDFITAGTAGLTDVERAARFYQLQRTCFGGKVSSRNFGVDPRRSRFNLLRLRPELEKLHTRLAGVMIENLPWQELLTRYDGPDILFYLDPPYWGGEKDYGKGIFSREDYGRMAAQLAGIRGAFLLSLNDRPEVRQIFCDFLISGVTTRYTVAAGGNQSLARELVITNRLELSRVLVSA